MIKAVIIDDEKNSAYSLAYSLQNCTTKVEIIQIYNDPALAVKGLPTLTVDILFLDISMPKMNGFEMLDYLEDIPFQVIFVTAFDNYAIEAFKVGAVDYLLKPVDEVELDETLQKVQRKIQKNTPPQNYKEIRYIYDGLRQPKISVGTQGGLEIIPIKNIIRCEADGSYTYIVCTDSKIMVTKPLKDLETMLEKYPFFRVHNSNLINLNYVRRYHKGVGGMAEMENGDRVAVSRYKKKAFLEVLENFY